MRALLRALSATWDLAPTRRLALFALALVLLVSVPLVLRDAHTLGASLQDTDDAMRLVAMRELLHGRGWYDQLQLRLQPPQGLWSHWSRLIDGGLALMAGGFGLFTSEARAETLTRIVWPLCWLPPAAAALLLSARRLAGRGARGLELRPLAVLAAGVTVLAGFGQLALQFHPGRVDHHDVQITLSLIVLAGAMADGVRGAVVAGAATGLGLAIGLEALLFEAVLAAGVGLMVLIDRRHAPRAIAFGLTLAGVTTAAFLIQTPPQRWGVMACDALGANLLSGAVLAGLGLAAAAWFTRTRSWPWRLAALALAGGLALAVYLGMDPRCTRGIFADVDPAVRPFWLDHVNEVRHWPELWKTGRPDAVAMAMAALMGLGAWATLGLVAARRRDPAWWMMGGALLLACAATWTAVRMRGYLEWFAMVPLAVAAAEAAARAPRFRSMLAVAAAAFLTPVTPIAIILIAAGELPLHMPPAIAPMMGLLVVLGLLVLGLRIRREGWRRSVWMAAIVLPLAALVALIANTDRIAAAKPKKKPDAPDWCYNAFAYRPLAGLPRGVTVSEVDFGPFVLAHTPSSSMTAPYHRMSFGILAARRVVTAPVDRAQAEALALSPGGRLGPVYVLECRRHARHSDRVGLRADSLQARLDADRPPAWLEKLSPPKAPLEVYRVRPLATLAPGT